MQEKTSIVQEEYLQAIYGLKREKGSVKAVHLAERLKTSAPTVHNTLNRMQRDGLAEVDEKKRITLTEEGQRQAEGLVRRHRLVEFFLCDTLGIPWHEAHQHAHILEHGLTPLVEQKLYEFLGSPKFCPHGTPFPGEEVELPDGMIHLKDCKEGMKLRIIMIDEILEEDYELMKYLHDNEILPERCFHLLEINQISQTYLLSSLSNRVSIPFDAAEHMGVLPLSES